MRKEGKRGEDGAALDDGVEDFRFEESAGGGGEMSEEKLFSEKQVSRGGDGDKFREALDEAEDDSEQPIRHDFGQFWRCGRCR